MGRQAFTYTRVVAFIIRDGALLLIPPWENDGRAQRLWNAPGGALEPYESIEEALIRETFEFKWPLTYIRSVVDLTGIDIACFGDLHRSCVLADNEIIAVFPGSVGAPLDEELCSGKYMVIEYDERQIRVFQRRVPFSGDAAINEMRQALLPGNEKFLWIERVLRGEKGSEWPAVIPPFVRKRRTKR